MNVYTMINSFNILYIGDDKDILHHLTANYTTYTLDDINTNDIEDFMKENEINCLISEGLCSKYCFKIYEYLDCNIIINPVVDITLIKYNNITKYKTFGLFYNNNMFRSIYSSIYPISIVVKDKIDINRQIDNIILEIIQQKYNFKFIGC